ncbi:MAG: hypothetical protein ACRDJG_06325 [Actinomycetota bacterium]
MSSVQDVEAAIRERDALPALVGELQASRQLPQSPTNFARCPSWHPSSAAEHTTVRDALTTTEAAAEASSAAEGVVAPAASASPKAAANVSPAPRGRSPRRLS